MDPINLAIGRALRRARTRRGITLRDLARASGGRIKATSVASWERAERRITVERFVELATLHGVPPGALLDEALSLGRADEEARYVVDVERSTIALPDLNEMARQGLADLMRSVQERRGGAVGAQVPVRASDLPTLAAGAGIDLEELLGRLEPVVHREAGREAGPGR